MSKEACFQKLLQEKRTKSIQVGKRSEELTDQALNLLENKQKIASWWPAKWQEEKRGGIDRIIQRLDGTEIPLQIKSSRTGVECALKNHPQIPCLQVKRDDTPFWVAGRILKIINR